MTTDVLFGSDPTPELTPDPNKNYLDELVGEGKKFKDPVALAYSKVEADAFIQRLQSENAELRKLAEGASKLDALMTKLESLQTPPKTENNGGTPLTPNPNGNPSENTLTIEAVQKLLSEREKQAKEEANLNFVVEQLRAAHGDNYKAAVTQRAKELSLDPEFLLGVARTNPQGFLKLVGQASAPAEAPAPQSPKSFVPASNVNPQALSSGTSNVPKMSDFSKLRKENPAAYFKPEVQNKIWELTKQYGPDFLNR